MMLVITAFEGMQLLDSSFHREYFNHGDSLTWRLGQGRLGIFYSFRQCTYCPVDKRSCQCFSRFIQLTSLLTHSVPLSSNLNILLSLFFIPSGFFLFYCILTILHFFFFSISLLLFSISQGTASIYIHEELLIDESFQCHLVHPFSFLKLNSYFLNQTRKLYVCFISCNFHCLSLK